MTDLPKHKMTADEFLAWAEHQLPEAGKFELWDGEVVVRHGPGFEEERSEHWDAKGAMFALCDAIKRAGLPCFAAVDGPMVRLSPNKMARPDVLVYCGPRVPRGVQEVPNPMILVEVLSPSTNEGPRRQAAGLFHPAEPLALPDHRPRPGAADPPQARGRQRHSRRRS